MRRLSFILSLLVATMILNQCGTSTRVKVLKPAELDVGAVKKVAVLDFEFVGSWDFADEQKKTSDVKEIAKILLKEMFKDSKKPPNPKQAYPGSTVSDRLVAKLVNNQYYTVVERKELSKILEEQALSLSGVIDANQATEIGRLLGAEGLVMGSGTYDVQDRGEWETYKEKKVEKKRYRIYRQVDVKFTYKIVNITTGSIIASMTNSASTGRSTNSKYSSTGKNEKEAMNSIPPWHPIVDDMVDKVLNQTILQVAPHYVTESRAIEEGDSDQMEVAVEYAQRNLWEDAREVWETVLQDPSAEKEDRVGATYNLGLYYELSGNLDQAEDNFDQAFKMSGDSKYLDSRARIQRRRKELERLQQQY